jgi:hypothetical protein
LLKNHVHPGQLYFLDELYAEKDGFVCDDSQQMQPQYLSLDGGGDQIPSNVGDTPDYWAQKTSKVLRLSLGRGPFGREKRVSSSSSSASFVSLASPSPSGPLLTNVSRLVALISSPSIMKPVRLSSYQQTWSEHALGCVIVLAAVKGFVSGGDGGNTMLQLEDSNREVVAEIDEHCINLTQLLPSHSGQTFDVDAANSSALSSRWRNRLFCLLLSRLDDLEDGDPAQRFRLNCIADVPAISAEEEAQQLQLEKRARH